MNEKTIKLLENGPEKDELFQSVCDHLFALQSYKGQRYGSSWCKHGEAISIFANVARKFDRLETIICDAVNENVPLPKFDSEESVAETVGDLATYCVLWLSWISVNRPKEFESWKKRIENFCNSQSKTD